MNKHALKLKLERRQARLMEKQKYVEDILATTDIPQNLSHDKKLKIYREFKRFDTQVITRTAVIMLVASLKSLYDDILIKDNELIFEYCRMLKDYINRFSEHNQRLNMLIQDLQDSFDINISKLYDELPKVQENEFDKYSLDTLISKSTCDNFKFIYAINVSAYVSFRLNNINVNTVNEFSDLLYKYYSEIVENPKLLQEYQKELIMKGVIVNLETGKVKELIIEEEVM